MPINIGGYGSERVKSILTTGEFGTPDLVSFGMLTISAFIPVLTIFTIVLGIVIYLWKGKHSRAWKNASIIMVIGGIIELIAQFMAGYVYHGINSGKIVTNYDLATSLGDKLRYIANYPVIKGYNILSGVAPTLNPLQSIELSGAIPNIS